MKKKGFIKGSNAKQKKTGTIDREYAEANIYIVTGTRSIDVFIRERPNRVGGIINVSRRSSTACKDFKWRLDWRKRE